MKNPYIEDKNTPALKWMWKHHKKQMIFTFLFVMIFILAPHIEPYRIEQDWLRWTLSGSMIILNFAITFLQPYLTYRSVIKAYHRWEKTHGDEK